MLTWRTATMSDVHAVFSDLSDTSAQEAKDEFGEWWTALTPIRKLMNLEGAQTEVLLDETGKPLAVFGHAPGETAKIRSTWFVFSKGFTARGAAATRACRNQLKALQLFYPDNYFHIYTRSQHRWRDRWLKLLGLRYTGTTADGAHHYVVMLQENHKPSDLGAAG